MASVSADTIDRSIAPASCERDNIELRPELSLLRAAFSDKVTEKRFIQHLTEEGFGREKLMQALGQFVFVAYGILDVLVAGDLSKEFLIVRYLLVAPLTIGLICLSWLKPFRRHFSLATSFALLMDALAIVYMIYRMDGPEAPPYIVGIIVVLIFTSCLMRINFVYAAPSYIMVALSYCFAMISKADAGYEQVVSGYFFLISVTIVAISTIYLQERRARETWISGEFRARDNEMIRHLLLEATAADRSKTNLLSIVTHELRTPLHQIIGFGEVVKNHPNLEESPKYLDQIILAANELLLKLGKMLRYADAAAGKLKVEMEMCSAVEIAERVKEEGRKAASARSIAIDISEVEESELWVDPHHASYAIQNIVENAVIASRPGSKIRLVGRRLPDGEYSLHIIDAGEGMTAAQLDAAFRPFAQAEAGLARYREGLGLGLPIANRLLTEQHARLSISSQVGTGTDVEIIFKTSAADATSDNQTAAA